MEILTERLLIREFSQEDLMAVHDYASNPDVVRYMAWGPNSKEETQSFIDGTMKAGAAEPRMTYEMAVTDRVTGHLLGGVGLFIHGLVGEIGYTLSPKYWGKGYGTEAAKAMVHFAFGEKKLHRVTATCDTRNLGSAKILEHCGMTLEGTLRDNMHLRDGWRSTHVYSILEDEYGLSHHTQQTQ